MSQPSERAVVAQEIEAVAALLGIDPAGITAEPEPRRAKEEA